MNLTSATKGNRDKDSGMARAKKICHARPTMILSKCWSIVEDAVSANLLSRSTQNTVFQAETLDLLTNSQETEEVGENSLRYNPFSILK